MQRRHWRALAPLLQVAGITGRAAAQQTLTWEQVRERFLAPNLSASRININRLAWANGSAGPTLGFEYRRTGPAHTARLIFSIPLRVFDRNLIGGHLTAVNQLSRAYGREVLQ